MSGYDVEALRAHFPSLAGGTAYFDGPGGTQTPDVVGEAMRATITAPLSNRGDLTPAERNADAAVVAARSAVADLTGGVPEGVVFGRSMTQLTFDLARALAKDWGPGDEVVVTRLDHDANVRPWVVAAEARGVECAGSTSTPQPPSWTRRLSRRCSRRGRGWLRAPPPPTCSAPGPTSRRSLPTCTPQTRCSMSTGCTTRRTWPATWCALGADFYGCSPYKFLGPHCGVVVADPALLATVHPDKLAPATDAVPERFELGTLPYELMAGTTAAIDLLASLGGEAGGRRARLVAAFAAIEAHEDALRDRLEEGLASLPVVLHSRAARRTPTLLLTFPDAVAAEVSVALAERDINAPSGNFYAWEASHHLGLGETGGLRVGLAPYSTDDEIDRLVAALAEILLS